MTPQNKKTPRAVEAPPKVLGNLAVSLDMRKDLENILNNHSREQYSNTPDFILADYLIKCLWAYEAACHNRQSPCLIKCEERNEALCRDWAEDHTHLQELCLKAGYSKEQVEGDNYGVPGISCLADMLYQIIEENNENKDRKNLNG